jgi:hypothetical protein
MRKVKHERIADATVDHLFEDMQNPRYQGEKFTWENFPTMAKNMLEANLFMHYAKLPKDFDTVKTQAGQYAFDYASQLVEKNKLALVVYSRKAPRPS